MASITAWAKKVWKDRKTEYPTRRTLTKTNGSQEIVTVARNEGNVSQEGDAFSAANMNDLENRIDAGFTELTGKLIWTVICTGVTLRDGYKWFNMDDYNEIYVVIQDDNNVYHPFIIPRNQIIDDPREFGDNVARFRCINGAIAIICNGGMSILCR
jgi:hypothetical protein